MEPKGGAASPRPVQGETGGQVYAWEKRLDGLTGSLERGAHGQTAGDVSEAHWERIASPFCLFFLIAWGIGYPTPNRYDPRETPGPSDVSGYAAIDETMPDVRSAQGTRGPGTP